MIRAADYEAMQDKVVEPLTLEQKVDALIAALKFTEVNGTLVGGPTGRTGMKYNKRTVETTKYGTPRIKKFTARIPITVMNHIRALNIGEIYDITDTARKTGIELKEVARRMVHSSANVRVRTNNNLRLHTYQEGGRIYVLRLA